MFKSILFAFTGVLVPFIYTWISGANSDFPLSQVSTGELILWFVGVLVGGWNLKALGMKFVRKVGYKSSWT